MGESTGIATVLEERAKIAYNTGKIAYNLYNNRVWQTYVFFRILILIKKTYGCYSENEKHIIFVCKDEEIPWKESEECKKAFTENLESQSESSAK